MRYFVIIVVLLSGVFCLRSPPAHAEAGEDYAQAASRDLVGTPAPRLIVKTIDGKDIDLGSLYGKRAVYLKFWATWCGPCRKQMPHFEAAFRQAGPDLAVIAINAGLNDTLDDVRHFRREFGLTMPIVLDDGQLGAAFHLRVTPQHVVIGRDGRIQYVGHFDDDRLEAALMTARTSRATPGLAGSAPKDTAHYELGDNVAQLSALTIDGDMLRTHERGVNRSTVLVFLSPWCESSLATRRPAVAVSCRTVREQVDQLAKENRARWIGIVSGIWASKADVREYRSRYQVSIPLALDETGELFRSFRVMNIPTLVIIDSEGRVARRIEGSDAELAAALRTALASG